MSTTAVNPLDSHAPRSRRERLITTLIFAVLAHGVILLGIGFVAFAPLHSPGSSVNITLVHSKKSAPSRDAAYLARVNQRGPGNTHRHVLARPSSASPHRFPKPDFALADRFAAAVPNPVVAKALGTTAEQRRRPEIVTTTARSTAIVPVVTEQPKAVRPRLLVRFARTAPRSGDIHAHGLELPRLYGPNANSNAHSVNALAALSAPYLLAWQRRIESIGTAQFARLVPKSVRGGHLTLAVTLGADGSVHAITIVKRSHQPLLDAAALKIIRLAAPFPPFPPALAAHTRTLSFSYRWNFIRGSTGAGMLGLGGR